ncbi:MAG TPA: hypothetical protein VFJ29_02020, partial [Candidatus Kapabacteria bacterium]|nr:hypothetical protein [Candidatus Kapabacteria bacterium]
YAGRVEDYPFDPPGTPRGNLLYSADLLDGGNTFSANLTSDDGIKLYSQIAFRAAYGISSVMSRTAFLAGIAYRGETKDFTWDGSFEYRYYGGLYNAGYHNYDVYYRDTTLGEYANSVGPHLYPLQNFDRPFSQWAVFTEYQDLKDVTGYTCYLKAKYIFYDRIFASATLDLNYIKVENIPDFLYPFYDIGIGWEPVKGISFTISRTNRAMNLDNSYQTLYMYKSAVNQAAIRWNL